MQITKYVLQGKLSLRSRAKKLIFWQLIAISVLTNLALAHQIYDVRCKVNGEIVGWFIKGTVCDDISQAKAASLELDRQERVQNNQDLMK